MEHTSESLWFDSATSTLPTLLTNSENKGKAWLPIDEEGDDARPDLKSPVCGQMDVAYSLHISTRPLIDLHIDSLVDSVRLLVRHTSFKMTQRNPHQHILL